MKNAKSIIAALTLFLGLGTGHAGVDAEADTKTTSKATLMMHSIRINRSKPEMHKTFGGRFYVESNPGVSLNFVLSLKDATLLPLGRDAVKVDTFLDDT